jgi:hypothetical protein
MGRLTDVTSAARTMTSIREGYRDALTSSSTPAISSPREIGMGLAKMSGEGKHLRAGREAQHTYHFSRSPPNAGARVTIST